MDEKDGKEEAEETDNENLRDLILQQFANLEPSETSDDDSYKVRLSCILEDDESESSRDFPKDVEKERKTTKESEKGPPGTLTSGLSEVMYDSEISDEFAGENLQITDLDDVTLCEKETVEETDEGKRDGFAIKKLKSSDNLHKRPFVLRRRELSSDSSDLDISVTNSAEGPPSDLKIIEVNEGDDENSLNIAQDNVYVESETSADEDLDQKANQPKVRGKSSEIEVVDNETLAPIFEKESRTYLEKTKGNVKWEENERVEKIFREFIEEAKKAGTQAGDQFSLQNVHIRGVLPKQYDPPVPPETYLWEELKRLRERGGYPWTYLDKPPFDEAAWKKYMEHVYEPINPPPLSAERKPEPPRETTKVQQSQGSSIPETDTPISQTPTKTAIAKKDSAEEPKASTAKRDSVEESKTSEDLSSEGAQELQDRLESRFLAQTPTATSDTTASQSKTDVTSTVLESSEFEDFSAKPGTLVKTRREQMRAQAAEIQQRLRNHAGRIRNKFSNIQKPSLKRKDRPKREGSTERTRFKLPEMHAPKISLPDRSKFKFPEKAKLHLPDSSKFHLPDTSKFHLPERPKFSSITERAKSHLPDRSKFHLPDKSKFHLPDKSKFHLPDKSKFHLPDRSKFHLPDKSKFHLPDRSKFHLPDKSKFHLPEKAKFSLPNRPKLDLKFKRSAGASGTSPGTSKSKIDFDFKSYPKLFTKHSKEYTTSSPKQTRGRTPPPRMQQDVQQSKPWSQNLKYVDDDLEDGEMRETDSRKSESLFEKDMGYMEDPDKVPTLSTKSSTSRLSEMSDDRKKGVLEEINPDEFFLRQKGISQDDIDMGQYLSREIREAFRSPDINALAKMDYMEVDDENIDPMKYHTEPKRPNRSGSGKTKSILKKTSTSNPSISDDGYKTYPPRRPGRKSRSQSKSLLNEEAVIAESHSPYETDVNVSRYDNDDVNLSRYDNVEYDEDNGSEYYKSPGPAREYQHYKVPRSHPPMCPSPPVKRKPSLEDEASYKRIIEAWNDELDLDEPPKPMARRKHRKKVVEQELMQEKPAEVVQEKPDEVVQETPVEVEQDKPEDVLQAAEEDVAVTSAALESFGDELIPQEISREFEEVVPKMPIESPVPPKRTRTRSSGSRSLRSLAADSDVNRSFHSEPPRDRLDLLDDEIIQEHRQMIEENPMIMSPDFFPPQRYDVEVTDLDDPGFGYATVGKPTVVKPERQKKKPDRPPPPRKKKEVAVPIYNTYPRRAPVRPLRNYSTLGPSRPPRHRKIPPIERSLSEIQQKAHLEMKSQFDEPLDFIEVSESVKELQTEKVIEKMKGRPLPPPPRPPRQKSKGPEDELETTEEEKLSLSILKDDEFPIERKVTAFVHEPPIERERIEEVTAFTQTDPLPEDFSFGTEDSSDMMPEFSHDQLKIQQAFLEEMKKEEEQLRQGGGNDDLIDAELKAEVIRQIEDIIAEEKRILERKNEERIRREASDQSSQKDAEGKKPKSYLDVDADMGYASLERRNHRQEPPASASQELPPKMEKLQVKELDVDTLNVREVQSDQIFVKELQSNRVASPDIDNRGGNIALGNIDLPPSFIEQVVAKIPWDALRQAQESHPESHSVPPVRPQRRQRGSQAQDDSDEETVFQPRRTHRRHHKAQYSTDEEERRVGTRRADDRRLMRPSSSVVEGSSIPELGLQLAVACTSAGAQALRNFIQTNASLAQSLDKELFVLAVLCIAVAMIAGFFLFGFDAKIIHTHRWDFQFPPQPPHGEF